jgi:hypothetical protein
VAVLGLATIGALPADAGSRAHRGLPGIIAFQRFDGDDQFQLWLANADLTNQRQISSGPYTSGFPSWKPDGTRLAFDSNRSDPDLSDDKAPNDVFTTNPDGTHVVQVTDFPPAGFSGDPDWSPDGKWLAYESDLGDHPAKQRASMCPARVAPTFAESPRSLTASSSARSALQALLHAAAVERLPTRALFEWSLSASAATDAVAILASHRYAAGGWSDSLEGMISSDPRTRDSIWMAVAQALSCLADPAVLDAVSPEPGEEFDPRDFLTQNGTLYLLATGAGAGASWPLVAAFMKDFTEVARHLAAASPGARLDPPVLMALDDIGNLAPLPSLPVLMAEGGGTGITTMPVLQSLAQARNKWGDHAATTIWDASIVKVILGGASASKDLQELSVLIGERDERSDTVSIGDYGARSLQRSTRRVAVMPPERIRTLPFGTGLVLLRSAPPIVTSLRTWTNR